MHVPNVETHQQSDLRLSEGFWFVVLFQQFHIRTGSTCKKVFLQVSLSLYCWPFLIGVEATRRRLETMKQCRSDVLCPSLVHHVPIARLKNTNIRLYLFDMDDELQV